MENFLLKNLFLDDGLTPRKIDYLTSLRIAWEELKKRDIRDVSLKSGAYLLEDGLKLKYFEDYYIILKNQENIYIENKKDIDVSLRTQILLLHYLNTSDGKKSSGEWITYRQLPTGPFYYTAYEKRSIAILEKSFRDSQDALLQASLKLNGKRAEFGDMGFVFNVLPKISIALSFWKGDEEFSSKINLLFDSNITHYLPLEDIVVLCQELSIKLVFKNKTDN